MQTQQHNIYDAIILGAGASGLMCALSAAKRGLKIALIDHNSHAGKKIAISGGGKCNFTNLNMGSDYFIGSSEFVEPALDVFSPKFMQKYFAKHALMWEEREHGQLFGCQSAKLLVRALVDDCKRHACHFFLEHSIMSCKKQNDTFEVTCTNNDEKKIFMAKNLVLALGSPAWANVGASDLGLKLAAKWGHSAKPFREALTSLQMPQNWALADLSGISLNVTLTTGNYSCSDALLFTHNGLSGPAALQASCHWQKNMPIYINFLPQILFGELLDAKECGKLYSRTLLCRHIPQRLADKILPEALARKKIAELSRKARNEIIESVHNYSIIPISCGKMQRSEACLGGINTNEVDPWSMESYKEKNLYIVGELLNITGQLGGYNFHFAFASGYLAGLNI